MADNERQTTEGLEGESPLARPVPQRLVTVRGVPPCEGPAFHGQPVYDPRPATWEPEGYRAPPATASGMNTGLFEFPYALHGPLMDFLEHFCVGITESREPNQEIGRKGSPYIDRWFLARKAIVPVASVAPDFADVAPFMRSELENLYLHGYHRGDADEPHDHPWPNASLVVRGWYRENVYDLERRYIATITRHRGDIVLRSARSIHAILETSENCLSLFATLRKERDWGFHTLEGFVPWREFPGADQAVRQPAQ